MTYKVEIEIEIPDAYNVSHVEEWLKFELHYSGRCSLDNPLLDADDVDFQDCIKNFDIY